jgi:myo-inositol-1(or 4)-monophosphatase
LQAKPISAHGASGEVQSPDQLLDVAVEAASRAARIIEAAAGRRSELVWKEKGEADFVTEADTHAESAIVETIKSRCPDAKVVGEELSPKGLTDGAGITFVVDPLDGTTNFLHGFPEYSVSIAVMLDGELVAGVVRNLTRPETFTATREGGAHMNREKISVSRETEPYRALIGTGFPFKRHDLLEKYARQFVQVSRHTAGVRRAGSAAIDLCNVACGRFDAFWELVLAPWDIAAGVLIVREAGGIVTDLSGEQKAVSDGPVVAGNPDIHAWLLRTICEAVDNETDSIR